MQKSEKKSEKTDNRKGIHIKEDYKQLEEVIQERTP
jgi:hypothetical protein